MYSLTDAWDGLTGLLDSKNFGSVLSLGSNLIQAYNSYDSGQRQQQISNRNAGLSIQEGQMAYQEAQYNAKLSQEMAFITERQIRQSGGKLIASQRVAYAKSGVISTTGTPLEVMANTAAEIETDALMARESGRLKHDAILYSGRTKTAAAYNKSAVQTFAGSVTASNSENNALGLLMGGIAGFSQKYIPKGK